jgi:Xaa-Pro dipeptidase
MRLDENPCSLDEIRLELAEKRRRIQTLLQQLRLDAVLISRHETIAWATAGLVDVRVGLLRETGAASLLITKDDRAYYLTTNNEAPRFELEEFSGLGYEALTQPWYANDVQASITEVVGDGIVAGDVPFGAAAAIPLQPLRLELTASECTRYRWLGRQTAEAATSVLLRLQPGMSERTIQAMLAERLIVAGLLPSVYLDAVDNRIRGFRHAVPRDGVLQRFGMIGFCARRWGLTCSITRFVHFGALPAELEEKFGVVAEVNARLLAATRPGTSSAALFEDAAATYASLGHAGAEKMHHQGGAAGYLEREWVARPEGSERVSSQQAFAWNPSLQGAKVEDTVLLQGDSIELLTGTPDLPSVTTAVDGIEYCSAGVLVG